MRIAEGKFALSFWVSVLLDKFLYCRPTHRWVQGLKSHGLPVSQGTITGGLKALCVQVRKQQLSELQASPCHTDETRWSEVRSLQGRAAIFAEDNGVGCLMGLDQEQRTKGKQG